MSRPPARRDESRYNVTYPGKLVSGARAVEGRVSDISAQGARFFAAEAPEPGRGWVLEVAIPGREPIRGPVEVVWTQREDDPYAEHPYQAGLKRRAA